ncbi:hypothetical protein [Oleiphilus sp. HI0079]|uniref:hypothetical protein n=1 Tax=Oleiphilus sp. HI0079 TaxID=1822254 RepID=UPI0012E6F5DB|nr:hypothetical protein [Oleiphilus sp. HI0079]
MQKAFPYPDYIQIRFKEDLTAECIDFLNTNCLQPYEPISDDDTSLVMGFAPEWEYGFHLYQPNEQVTEWITSMRLIGECLITKVEIAFDWYLKDRESALQLMLNWLRHACINHRRSTEQDLLDASVHPRVNGRRDWNTVYFDPRDSGVNFKHYADKLSRHNDKPTFHFEIVLTGSTFVEKWLFPNYDGLSEENYWAIFNKKVRFKMLKDERVFANSQFLKTERARRVRLHKKAPNDRLIFLPGHEGQRVNCTAETIEIIRGKQSVEVRGADHPVRCVQILWDACNATEREKYFRPVDIQKVFEPFADKII